MTEGPVIRPLEESVERFKVAVRAAAVTSVFFVTVKDNRKDTRWSKIGKVSDWMRKYSDTYYLVRGVSGGIHFHAVCVLKQGCVIRYQKGIHMNVRPLSDRKCDLTREEVEEMKIGKEKCEHFRELRIMRIGDPNCAIIASMIRKYWESKKARGGRIRRKLVKNDSIERMVMYLEKNLDEGPRPVGKSGQYVDWMLKTQGI